MILFIIRKLRAQCTIRMEGLISLSINHIIYRDEIKSKDINSTYLKKKNQHFIKLLNDEYFNCLIIWSFK